MNTRVFLLVITLAGVVVLYFLLNAVATVWEKAMKRPYPYRRLFIPVLALCLVIAVVQFALGV